LPKTAASSAADPHNSPLKDKALWDKIRTDATAGPVPQPPMRVWLLDRNGIADYSSIAFTPEMLEEKLNELRREVGSNVARRLPSTRGFAAVPAAGLPSFDETLASLGQLLIPVNFWRKLRSYRQIVVVPEMAIAEVPFALLKGPDGVMLTETAGLWIARGMIDMTDQGDALMVTDWTLKMNFTFDNPLVAGNPRFMPDRSLSLPPLPGAQAEAIAVSELMGTKPLLGTEATKPEIVARAKESDVIYIATHGMALSDDPMSSFLALANAPEAQGRWSAKEIQSLDLRKTDLAVLSACQTGLGMAHAGGVIGVGRAFASAGVRWVVTSLWNVDDTATVDLMTRFVANMGSCKNVTECLPATALQTAMADTRKIYPDPKLWGAFVVFGVPSGARLDRLQLQ
jgi:CHAT domain-containing protein